MGLRILLIAFAFALTGLAPAPFPRTQRQRGGPADVNGTWEIVTVEHRGAANDDIRKSYTIEMTRGEAVFVEKKGQRTIYPMDLDEKATPPSFTWKTGNRVGYVGSYRLEKEQMTIIFAPGSQIEDR